MTLVMFFVLAGIVFGARLEMVRALAAAAALALALPAAAQPPIRLEPFTGEIWTGWEDLGGQLFRGTACVATQANRLDCFGSQSGGIIGRRQWNGTAWLNWTSLGGLAIDSFFSSRPECVSWGPDHIDCFVRRDSDKALFRRTMEGGYTGGWEALGFVLPGDPSCVSTAPRRLDCFAAGNDGQLHQISFDGDIWGPWTPRGGEISVGSKPSCVVYRGGIHCIATRAAGQLQMWKFAPTGAPVSLTSATQIQDPGIGVLPSPRCVVSPGSGLGNDRIQCFAPIFVPVSGPALGRWMFDGNSWSVSSMGDIPWPRASYDWDCVARGGEQVDCVELIGQLADGFPPPGAPIVRVVFRHVQLSHAIGAAWSTGSLTPVAGSGIPIFVRCASWGADRLDCFATGGNLYFTRLWHAWLAPQPSLPRPVR